MRNQVLRKWWYHDASGSRATGQDRKCQAPASIEPMRNNLAECECRCTSGGGSQKDCEGVIVPDMMGKRALGTIDHCENRGARQYQALQSESVSQPAHKR